MTSKNRYKLRKKQIPRLCCGMTNKNVQEHKYVGKRFGWLQLEGVRRGSSRSKDALRMTSKRNKGGMRGFFAALRMTSKKNRQRQGSNTEILASPE
jgi:hypothetical protein